MWKLSDVNYLYFVEFFDNINSVMISYVGCVKDGFALMLSVVSVGTFRPVTHHFLDFFKACKLMFIAAFSLIR